MPNRIIKESIKTSRDINRLSWFEEVFFYRLIVSADDYGRYDGDPLVLKNTLFPTKDNIPVRDIEEALLTLGETGLVDRYKVADGRMVLQILGWTRHQTVRAKKSKYPPPDDKNVDKPVEKSIDSNCTQMISNENKCARIRIRDTKSYSYSGTETECESDARAREPDQSIDDVDNTLPFTVKPARRAVMA